MRIPRRIHRLLRPTPSCPVQARHALPTFILSADDDTPPSDSLIRLALRALQECPSVDLSPILAREGVEPLIDLWPGEHYRLLAALVKVIQPRTVVDIGTFTGLSCLAMERYLPPDGKITTFDVVPYTTPEPLLFRLEDFQNDRIHQHVGDLSQPDVMQTHASLLGSADLILLDGPHDGATEQKMLDGLAQTGFQGVLVMDDIRFMDMLAVWRGIRLPKLDLTSFGHWSGTGLVEWGGATGQTG